MMNVLKKKTATMNPIIRLSVFIKMHYLFQFLLIVTILHTVLSMESSLPTVMVLCTGNSCRSHMGEGFLRASVGDKANVISAGSKPVGYVHPLAVQVMSEVGIDISAHTSKSMRDFLSGKVDIVISVCGNADQVCPQYPGQVARYHCKYLSFILTYAYTHKCIFVFLYCLIHLYYVYIC
jgi:protein-tyrosine-phosphatase